MTYDALEVAFENGTLLHFKKGHIVLRPGDTPSCIYYIVKGYVKLYTINEDGSENILFVYGPNDLFAFRWVLNHHVRNVYYETLNSVTVRKLPRNDLLIHINDPRFMRMLLNRLVVVLEVYENRIENLGLAKAYARLVVAILFLANRFGKQNGNRVVIEAPLTHADIANMINITRETASREFKELLQKKLIIYKYHMIIIKDIDKFKKELTLHYERASL